MAWLQNENAFIKRASILERLDYSDRNLYCKKSNLTNETSVESFFVVRMLANLGFKDEQIKTKESIDNLTVAKGSRKILYKPDYCVFTGKNPKIIIDAKSTKENINDWIERCAHYCLAPNRQKKPIDFFILTNGLITALYKWDEDEPLIEMHFEDFYAGGKKYERLRNLISAASLKQKKTAIEGTPEKLSILEKIHKEEAQKLFLSCINIFGVPKKEHRPRPLLNL